MRTQSFVAALVLLAGAAHAQTYLMMPDSTNNRVVLFNATDGSLVNSSYFALAGNTPVHAMQVGQEIWVSEQIGDRLSRWSLTGTAQGAVAPGLDNVRGMALINGTVYATNAGTANGAPGANAIVMFDTAGTNLGFINTTGMCNSPFGILAHNGNMLVSGSSNASDVWTFTTAGASVGVFHNSTSISFAEQMDHALNGDVLVACFTTGGIMRLDPTTGAVISNFPASGARGVHQLPNGNVMWTSAAGVFIYNAGDGISTNIYAGGGRYIDVLTLAPPCGSPDFDCDGDVGTDADIEAFFACIAGNCPAAPCTSSADFNSDGDIGTDADIEAFFRVLGGGQC